MRHHRLGLHAVLSQKTFARPYPGLGTSLQLEWKTRTTIPKSLPMVGMATIPNRPQGSLRSHSTGVNVPFKQVPIATKWTDSTKTTQTVYQFHRVFMGRVSRVFPWQPGQDHSSPPRSHQTGIVRSHLAKTTAIASPRLTAFITLWECQWDRLRQQPDVIAFVNSRQFTVPSLNPRDAFFGGRTNAVRLWPR